MGSSGLFIAPGGHMVSRSADASAWHPHHMAAPQRQRQTVAIEQEYSPARPAAMSMSEGAMSHTTSLKSSCSLGSRSTKTSGGSQSSLRRSASWILDRRESRVHEKFLSSCVTSTSSP